MLPCRPLPPAFHGNAAALGLRASGRQGGGPEGPAPTQASGRSHVPEPSARPSPDQEEPSLLLGGPTFSPLHTHLHLWARPGMSGGRKSRFGGAPAPGWPVLTGGSSGSGMRRGEAAPGGGPGRCGLRGRPGARGCGCPESGQPSPPWLLLSNCQGTPASWQGSSCCRSEPCGVGGRAGRPPAANRPSSSSVKTQRERRCPARTPGGPAGTSHTGSPARGQSCGPAQGRSQRPVPCAWLRELFGCRTGGRRTPEEQMIHPPQPWAPEFLWGDSGFGSRCLFVLKRKDTC